MSNLLNLITDALGDIDVSAAVSGEAGNLANIGNTLAQLTEGKPDALGDFVESIAEIEMPGFDFADDLMTEVGNIRELIPADIGEVLHPINDALENIDSSLGDGLGEIVTPLLNAFRAIDRVIHTDFSFAQGTAGDGGGDGDAAAASAPVGLVSSDPDTQVDPVRLEAFQSVLDELPADPTVGNLLEWFNSAVTIGRGDMVEQALRHIPFLDDVRAPLNTVLTWKDLSTGDFETHINQTLQTLQQAIINNCQGWMQAQLQQLADIIATLDTTQLQTVVSQIRDQLEAIRTHIANGTLDDAALTLIENELNPLIAQRDALVQQFLDHVKTDLDQQLKKLEVIPALLEEKMSALILLLQPPASSFSNSEFPPAMPAPTAFTGLEGLLSQYQTVFENLINALDISEITDTFAEPAEAIEQAVDEIDQAITMVTLEITQRLNQVRDAIAALDVANVVDNAETAITDYTGQIVGSLTAAFSQVRDAIEAIAVQITAVVSTFNPASIVSEIEDGIDALGTVLQSPEVTSVLDVLEKLKSIADRLDRVSFTPVTDTVVGSIDEMTAAVQGLGSNLDDPLKGLLSEALDALPDDLHPVTDPLVDGLGDLIDAGPVPLLQAIKDVPQEILDAIKGFEPGELIGDTLSEPFQNIISEIQAFEPDQLLDPVSSELDNFKNRVRENANPAQLFDPLIEVHEQVLQDMQGFNPGEIIAPLNQALTDAIKQVTDAIPVDDIFDEIQAVISDIQRILGADGVADSIIELIQALRSYLTPFVDATESVSDQIQTWLDDALAVIDSIDVSGLQTAFNDLNTTIDATQAAALQSLYDTTLDPVNTALKDVLKPRTLMTALVRSRNQLRGSLDGLDAALSARIDTILLDVNPTAPDFSSVFNTYNRTITVMNNTREDLQSTLSAWDATYHQLDGVLASYRQVPASPQELKDWIITTLDGQLIRPLQSIFEKFAPTARLLDAFIGPLVDLVNALRGTVNDILAAPTAIVDVADSLEQIRDRLQEIDLDFISDSIDDIYDEVKTQFRGLDPRGLKNAVNEAFESIIGLIDIDQVIPVGALNATDDELDNALEALRQLDPQVLITEVIEPKFDEILAPFLSALDLTPALTALSDRLSQVEEELRVEMDRVNESYQQFTNAVP
ncbi:MAG: hypothetical protein R3208_16710 [Ketobacteraceae bacterium]|nr:hypothetical protein [Ketobacteraceae bacterium]